uniref:Lrp/AsnC family transcriptional regulator n=1 Tax=Pedobacter schmidteae TaxID=2201271 RepID=UPI000EB04723|nr:Lrp/AsnC family transcriptional regulator [Pedobacter schmidteae]
MTFHLDEIDLKLLLHLQKNSRMSLRELSHEIHLSDSSVRSRIQRLETEGYIKQYTAILNKVMIKRNLVSFTGIRLKENNYSTTIYFLDKLREVPGVYNCYYVNGMFDFLLHMVVGDMQEYYNTLVHILAKINGVSRITTFFVLNEMEGEKLIDLSHLKSGYRRYRKRLH